MASRRFEDDDRHETYQERRIERELRVPTFSRRAEREVDNHYSEELAVAKQEIEELKRSRGDGEQYKVKERMATEKREREIQEIRERIEYEKQMEIKMKPLREQELKQQKLKEQKLQQREGEISRSP
jgi:hypothetical protein